MSGPPADLLTSASCWLKVVPCSPKVSYSLLRAPLAIPCLDHLLRGPAITYLEAYGSCLGLPARGVCSPQLESSPVSSNTLLAVCILHGGTGLLGLVWNTHDPRKLTENHTHRLLLCLNTHPTPLLQLLCHSCVDVGNYVRWCPSTFSD